MPPWILGMTGIAVALSVIVLAACRSTSSGGDRLEQPLAFDDMKSGVTSGVADSGLHVLRDQAALDALWRQHTRLQLPTPPAPEVDFGVSMVVAAFAGQKPSGGYSIRIDGVTAVAETPGMASQVVVRTLEGVPAADAAVTMMTTSPFHMVCVQRADGAGVLAAED